MDTERTCLTRLFLSEPVPRFPCYTLACSCPHTMNSREQFHTPHRYYTEYANELHARFERGTLTQLLLYPQFVVWRHEEIDGQAKKPPYDPKTGRRADVSSPHGQNTWATWQEALAALRTGSYNGVGFVVSKSDPFTFLDLDTCVNTNRFIHKWAHDLAAELATYTEYSPHGLHLITDATLPGPGRKVGPLEVYDRDHYFTLSLRRVPETPRTIEPRQEEITKLYNRITGRDHLQNAQTTGGAVVWSQPAEQAPRMGSMRPDEQIMKDALAEKSSNFARYWQADPALWTGPHAPRRSRSEAEYVLALMLLTKTGNNEEQTNRLYKQSDLYDEKRCSRISGHDPQTGKPLSYLDVTIRSALRYRQAQRKQHS